MNVKQIALGLMLATNVLTASAEETRLALAPELKTQENLYTVEVVLFKQKQPAYSEESLTSEQVEIDFTDARLTIPYDGMPLSANEELEKSQYSLTNETSKLERQGYEVLYHNAWLQQFNPYTKSTLMVVDPLGSFEGTLRIDRQRFLHVYPDIHLFKATGAEQAGQTIRMQESRRMRSEELHYIDHPVLGMLVLFRPVVDAG